MKPIRPGDRGPAVEDIQRRLRTLGYDLGPTGIDGAFQGLTQGAVESFQAEYGVAEAGFVGEATWSALVDATFTLGDRMLYLRVPHFHGRDVRELQEALNALGFAAGEGDSIFGSCTERALREFQANMGLQPDGIAGSETVKMLSNLRHVWLGKNGHAHADARKGPARAADVLTRNTVLLAPLGEFAEDVSGRVVNLALATTDEARVVLQVGDSSAPAEPSVSVRISDEDLTPDEGTPVVRLASADDGSVTRLVGAIEAAASGCHEVLVVLEPPGGDRERAAQRAAVALLDALCLALA
ncbi:MAG: peptidoglycan-binding protein [Coriobacteriales bacterium]|nr:peptidoglycan-binding protein [Coriobacteriales bacterium]